MRRAQHGTFDSSMIRRLVFPSFPLSPEQKHVAVEEAIAVQPQMAQRKAAGAIRRTVLDRRKEAIGRATLPCVAAPRFQLGLESIPHGLALPRLPGRRPGGPIKQRL